MKLGEESTKNFENQIKNIKQKKQQIMDTFTIKGNCEICDTNISPILCKNCKIKLNSSLIILKTKIKKIEIKDFELTSICSNCVKFEQNSLIFMKNQYIGNNCCENLDCNIFYERCRVITKLEDNIEIMNKLKNLHFLDW